MHEAVMSPPTGEGRLVVTEELRRGYRLKGRLVRPALVAVDYETATS
jgi:molecular chaperone GrpE (heat shock protein)